MEGGDTAYTGVKTVFARDYTEPEAPEQTPSEWELAALERTMLQSPVPYCVDRWLAQQFYMTLSAYNQLAMAFSGRIRATLDYDYRTAEIVLESMTLEFGDKRRLESLHEIGAKARYVRIKSLPDGFFQLRIHMPYFI